MSTMSTIMYFKNPRGGQKSRGARATMPWKGIKPLRISKFYMQICPTENSIGYVALILIKMPWPLLPTNLALVLVKERFTSPGVEQALQHRCSSTCSLLRLWIITDGQQGVGFILKVHRVKIAFKLVHNI